MYIKVIFLYIKVYVLSVVHWIDQGEFVRELDAVYGVCVKVGGELAPQSELFIIYIFLFLISFALILNRQK